jgi:hypothetical protein
MKSKLFHVSSFLKRAIAEWYQTEKNTAALIGAVIGSRDIQTFSGDDLWNLLRLTWITVHRDEPTPDHWKGLKVPALAHLFGREPVILDDLKVTIDSLGLPPPVTAAARKTTGLVNFRNVWRNSCRNWCSANRKALIEILSKAHVLSPNDHARFSLAAKIEALPGIPSPNGANHVGAAAALTPVVACLDPSSRFPIVNGRESVRDLLRALALSNGDLERQATGLINLIGQFGIEDAFMLDALAQEIAAHVPSSLATEEGTPGDEEGGDLPYLDEDERSATIKSQTIQYRNRHNKMTNRLKFLFPNHTLKPGKQAHCRYDVLMQNYDGSSRDLLIEAKPDPDRGAIRIAIGQLLDYRRHLPNRLATDLAMLTIVQPPQPYIELLFDLQISALWFTDKTCSELAGSGKVWSTIEKVVSPGP